MTNSAELDHANAELFPDTTAFSESIKLSGTKVSIPLVIRAITSENIFIKLAWKDIDSGTKIEIVCMDYGKALELVHDLMMEETEFSVEYSA